VLRSTQVVELCMAFAHAMPQHPSAKPAFMTLLPSFSAALVHLRQDEFVQVMWAATVCLCEEQGKEQSPTEHQPQTLAKEHAPTEVTTFFAAAQSQARKHLPAFSGQELAKLAQACTTVHGRLDTKILQEVVQEAANRLKDIDTEALLSLLQSLVTVGDAVRDITRQHLFAELRKRMDSMQEQERKALSHVCAEGLRLQCPPDGFSIDSLQSCCQALSQDVACPTSEKFFPVMMVGMVMPQQLVQQSGHFPNGWLMVNGLELQQNQQQWLACGYSCTSPPLFFGQHSQLQVLAPCQDNSNGAASAGSTFVG